MNQKKRTVGSIGLSLLLVAVAIATVAVGPAAAAGDVTITVEDPSATGIDNATVALHDSAGVEVSTSTTDTNGAVTFSSVSDGDYQAVVTSSAHETAVQNVSVNGSAVTQTVTLRHTIDSAEVEISDSSNDVWAEITNATDENDSAVGYNVVFVGMNSSDENATPTVLKDVEITDGSGVSSSEVTLSDAHRDELDVVDVQVVSSTSSITLEAFDAGTLEAVSGGGGGGGFGGLLDTTVMGIPLVLILGGLVVGYFVFKEE